MQALIVAALVATAAAGIAPALPALATRPIATLPALAARPIAALPALAARPIATLPTLSAKPIATLPTLTGGSYGYGTGLVGRGAIGGLSLGAARPLGVVKTAAKAVVDYAEPRPYQYQYAVDDPQYGPMFNKAEQSDGAGTVQGSYAVNLPDGRTQIVKYASDAYNGFNAEVSYEGYAQHPQVARGYGYGAIGAKKVVATTGLGLIGRPAGIGLTKIGASLLGPQIGIKSPVYGRLTLGHNSWAAAIASLQASLIRIC